MRGNKPKFKTPRCLTEVKQLWIVFEVYKVLDGWVFGWGGFWMVGFLDGFVLNNIY